MPPPPQERKFYFYCPLAVSEFGGTEFGLRCLESPFAVRSDSVPIRNNLKTHDLKRKAKNNSNRC